MLLLLASRSGGKARWRSEASGYAAGDPEYRTKPGHHTRRESRLARRLSDVVLWKSCVRPWSAQVL